MQEQLYTAAAVITTPRSAIVSGEYDQLDSATGLRNFVSIFATHVATEALRMR